MSEFIKTDQGMEAIKEAIIDMKNNNTDIAKFSPASNTELFIIKKDSESYNSRTEKGLIISSIEIDNEQYAISIS